VRVRVGSTVIVSVEGREGVVVSSGSAGETVCVTAGMLVPEAQPARINIKRKAQINEFFMRKCPEISPFKGYSIIEIVHQPEADSIGRTGPIFMKNFSQYNRCQ
jgi:hypothetical protein